MRRGGLLGEVSDLRPSHELARESLDRLNTRARERGLVGSVRVATIGSGREVITLESYVPAWNDHLELSIALDSAAGGAEVVSASLSVMASGELLAHEQAAGIRPAQVAPTTKGQIERLETVMWTVLGKDPAGA